jgi:cell division protein FtsW
MGVTVGLFPVTGMTLPLISYGRTSFLIFMALLGMVRSIEKDIMRRIA